MWSGDKKVVLLYRRAPSGAHRHPLARAYIRIRKCALWGIVCGTGIDTGRAWATGEDAGGDVAGGQNTKKDVQSEEQ